MPKSSRLIYGLVLSLLIYGCATIPTKQEKLSQRGTNAYLNYKNAVDLLKEPQGAVYYMYAKVLSMGWSEENKALERFLFENTPALKEIEKGAEKEVCRLPEITTAEEAGKVLYYVNAFKELAKLLILRTNYYIYKRDYRKAIQDSFLVIRFGQHIETAGDLISKRIGVAIQGNGYKNLRDIVSQARKLDYLSLIKEIEAIGKRLDVRQNLVETLTTQLSYIKIDLYPLFFDEKDWKFLKESYQSSGYTQQEIIKSIKNSYYDAIAYSDFPYPDGLEVWRLEEKPKNPVREKIMPILRNIYIECGRLETERNATLITVALEYYYAKNKKYPEKLDELTPTYIDSLPPDPFSGKYFIYKKTHKGWQMYSIGSDLEDNCASKHSYYSEDGKGDIIFSSR